MTGREDNLALGRKKTGLEHNTEANPISNSPKGTNVAEEVRVYSTQPAEGIRVSHSYTEHGSQVITSECTGTLAWQCIKLTVVSDQSFVPWTLPITEIVMYRGRQREEASLFYAKRKAKAYTILNRNIM